MALKAAMSPFLPSGPHVKNNNKIPYTQMLESAGDTHDELRETPHTCCLLLAVVTSETLCIRSMKSHMVILKAQKPFQSQLLKSL